MPGMYNSLLMGGVTEQCGIWSMLPTDRVVSVRAARTLLEALDTRPESAPVVSTCQVAGNSVGEIVDSVLDELEAAARGLFPAWLPGAEVLTGRSALDIRAVRVLSRKLSSITRHFGPFVSDLAVAALLGKRMTAGRFARETRAAGLTRILAESYPCPGIALLVVGPTDADPNRQRILASACEWLSDHTPAAVWIAGEAIPDIDRFPEIVLPRPEAPHTTDDLLSGRTRLRYPAPVGRPHPGSAAEQKLERALETCEWATGRRWNMPYRTSPLRPPIRMDLIWPDARCVVEVDGDDHRLRHKYAADRTRDVQLQLDGFGVLRFTNEQVLDDVATVLVAIEQFLTDRRREQNTLLATTTKGLAQ